jgi:aryl-alcohol dehydrogenase-like predicted oxidoreductase
MEYKVMGRSGIAASAMGFGTWAIGGGPWWGVTDDAESIKAIQVSIDAGITLIDTAPAYGFGHSEEVVGKAIAGRRDKVILSTKCGLWWGDDRGSFVFELQGTKVKRSLRPETIRIELEESLKRLGTDYIDLYHTHWQSIEPDKTPIDETMECLLKLKEEGKIRSIGVSNVERSHLEEYLAAGGIDVNQARYSMLDRALEAELLPYCRENTVSIMAYSPLEQGLLTGKIGMSRQFTEVEYRNRLPWFKSGNRKRVLDMLEGWQPLTESYGCTMAQLVIAWTLKQPGITFVLCGARQSQQAAENAMAGTLNIKESDIAIMRLQVEKLGDPV